MRAGTSALSPKGGVLPHMERRGSYVLLDDILRTHGLPGVPAGVANSTKLFMTPDEGATLLGTLLRHSPRVFSYVEWGQGGSTELVASLITGSHRVMPRAFRAESVESDGTWTALLRQRSPIVRRAEALGALKLRTASYGPMRQFGHPVSARSKAMLVDDPRVQREARRYVAAPFQSFEGVKSLDVAFVDGRFRVACALEALKHAHAKTRVLVHDYAKSGARAVYERVTRHYRLVSLNDSLLVLEPLAVALSLPAAEIDAAIDSALGSSM